MCVERIALQQVPQGQFQPHKECHKLHLTQVRLQSQPNRETSYVIDNDSEKKSRGIIFRFFENFSPSQIPFILPVQNLLHKIPS